MSRETKAAADTETTQTIEGFLKVFMFQKLQLQAHSVDQMSTRDAQTCNGPLHRLFLKASSMWRLPAIPPIDSLNVTYMHRPFSSGPRNVGKQSELHIGS